MQPHRLHVRHRCRRHCSHRRCLAAATAAAAAAAARRPQHLTLEQLEGAVAEFNSGELRGCPGNLEAAFALGVDALAELGALAGDKACEQHVALKREKRSTVNSEWCYGPMPFPALETRYQLLSPRVRARANALGKQLTGSLAVPCGRRRQRNGLVYHAGYEGFDPESWQVIVKAHESVRLELAPPVHGALQTVVLILRSPTTCYKELIATTSTTLARPRDRGARIRGSCARTMARVGWDNPIVRCVCVHDQ